MIFICTCVHIFSFCSCYSSWHENSIIWYVKFSFIYILPIRNNSHLTTLLSKNLGSDGNEELSFGKRPNQAQTTVSSWRMRRREDKNSKHGEMKDKMQTMQDRKQKYWHIAVYEQTGVKKKCSVHHVKSLSSLLI